MSGISLVFPSFIADEGEHEITIECGEETFSSNLDCVIPCLLAMATTVRYFLEPK